MENITQSTFVKSCKNGYEICFTQVKNGQPCFSIYYTDSIRTKPHYLVASDISEEKTLSAIDRHAKKHGITDYVIDGVDCFAYFVLETNESEFSLKGHISREEFGDVFDWANFYGIKEK